MAPRKPQDLCEGEQLFTRLTIVQELKLRQASPSIRICFRPLHEGGKVAEPAHAPQDYRRFDETVSEERRAVEAVIKLVSTAAGVHGWITACCLLAIVVAICSTTIILTRLVLKQPGAQSEFSVKTFFCTIKKNSSQDKSKDD